MNARPGRITFIEACRALNIYDESDGDSNASRDESDVEDVINGNDISAAGESFDENETSEYVP